MTLPNQCVNPNIDGTYCAFGNRLPPDMHGTNPYFSLREPASCPEVRGKRLLRT